MSWISLHNHSSYSILDSTVPVKGLAHLAGENNMSAIALTDSGNMFGAVDFYKASLSQKVKPIIGCELMMAHESRFEKKKRVNSPLAYPIILLVKNKIGYKNLCSLTSKGYLEGFYYYPRIDKELLCKYSEGLICLCGCVNSSLGYKILNADEKEVKEETKWYCDLFKDDFYFEIQNHQMTEEQIVNDSIKKEAWLYQKYTDFIQKQTKVSLTLLQLSKEYNIKCIATNDVHYEKRQDWAGHEILMNIASGEVCEVWEVDSKGVPRYKIANPKRKTLPSHEYYFKSIEQMQALFGKGSPLLENTLEIANKCEFSFDLQTKHYPLFFPQDLKEGENRQQKVKEYLYKLCSDAIATRYTSEKLKKIENKYPNQNPLDIVKKRLDYEFDLIASKGMCDYF